MSVDVRTEIEIDRPVHDVAAYAGDPSNAPEWYVNIDSVRWRGEPGVRVGAVAAFAARFLGRRLEYDYEIVDVVPDARLVMRTDRPFSMETSYTWEATAGGGTRMALRNRGAPTGFSRLVAPVLGLAMRRANRSDLRRLKALLEGRR